MADSEIELLSHDSHRSDVSYAQYLYDFNEEPIAIFYKLTPVGFAIYDFEKDTVLEHSKEFDNPFYIDSGKKYYYNGVCAYYEKVDNKFVNLATGRIAVIDREKYGRDNFYADNDLQEYSEPTHEILSKNEKVSLLGSTRLYNCNTDKNLPFFYPNLTRGKPDKHPGVCGSTACAILAAYYADHKSELAGSGDFATDWKKTAGSVKDKEYGKYLVKELVELIEPDGKGSFLLAGGMSEYLRNHGINGTLNLGILTVYQQTKDAIGSDGKGVSLIVGTFGHYCVGIGYRNYPKKQIKVNTGWGYIEWFDANTIISTWTMKVY